jgi:hypothetical protein
MIKIIILFTFFYASNLSALEPLTDGDMQLVLGQGGVYLTGDITINETGGPLNNSADLENPGLWKKNCTVSNADKRCGARLAVNAGDGTNSGWLVLDNIRGRFSFEGMTLRTRSINSGFNGDGAVFDQDVLEIGLPNTVKYTDVTFTLANSSAARPTDVDFKQTDIFNVRIDGDVTMQGNLLLFPTGTP